MMDMACEQCLNGFYDEEFDEYACTMLLDEDEFLRVMQSETCPYFRAGDEYSIVRKQN
ncbi:MAG: hypothetical protein HFH27_05205 [Clostridiaceae bacterium]|nr:hypothetical protein [Clostridiaceae bacterium]